ncbi:hypothetical protein ACSU1N_01800 [Thermogladius sp. 4427co]
MKCQGRIIIVINKGFEYGLAQSLGYVEEVFLGSTNITGTSYSTALLAIE